MQSQSELRKKADLVKTESIFTPTVTQTAWGEENHERRTYLVAGLQRALPFQSSRIAGQVFLVVTFIFLFQLLSGFFQFVEELKSNIRVTQSSAYLQESSWNPINHMGPSVPQFQLPINDSYRRRQNLGFWRFFFSFETIKGH